MFFRLLRAWSIGTFGKSLAFNSKRPIKCLSLNNQPCKDRPSFFYTNSDKTLFYLVLISLEEVVTLSMIYILEFVFQIKKKKT